MEPVDESKTREQIFIQTVVQSFQHFLSLPPFFLPPSVSAPSPAPMPCNFSFISFTLSSLLTHSGACPFLPTYRDSVAGPSTRAAWAVCLCAAVRRQQMDVSRMHRRRAAACTRTSPAADCSCLALFVPVNASSCGTTSLPSENLAGEQASKQASRQASRADG